MPFQRRVVSALWLLSTAPASVLPQAPPIALRVVYPAAEDRVRVRDSSFLLGSVSGPDVRLSINGSRVRVADNGAWLAWLPFPPDSVMQFRIEAFRGQDSSVINYLVRRDPRFVPGEVRSGRAWIDTMSLTPRGQAWIRPGRVCHAVRPRCGGSRRSAASARWFQRPAASPTPAGGSPPRHSSIRARHHQAADA